jgi:hypothetical protein
MLIILVLDTFDPLYSPLRQALKDTWVKKALDQNITVIFYKGNPSLSAPAFNDEGTLLLPCSDDLAATSQKLCLALGYLLDNFEFAYVYRTNLSSFLFVDALLRQIETIKSPLDVYSGVVGECSILRSALFRRIAKAKAKLQRPVAPPALGSVSFASGSGFLISKDLVRLFVHEYLASSICHLVDDVSLGFVLNKCGIFPTPFGRCDLYDDYALSATSLAPLDPSCFHYRVKGANRLKDASIMYFLDGFVDLAGCIEWHARRLAAPAFPEL